MKPSIGEGIKIPHDAELVDNILKLMVIKEYHSKWRDEFIEKLKRFECDEKKNVMVQLFLQELYLRRPEAFLKNNPDHDQQPLTKPNPMNDPRMDVKIVKEPCTKCPKN